MPARSYGGSFSTIVFVFNKLSVVASPHHQSPDLVNLMKWLSASGVSVLNIHNFPLYSVWWGEHGGFYIKAVVQSSTNGAVVLDVEMPAEKRERSSYTSNSEDHAPARILALLNSRRPSTVISESISDAMFTGSAGIISVVVNSFDAASDWRFAHAFKEIQIVRFPKVADYNSSTSIARITRISPVVTPANHVPPTLIGFSFSTIPAPCVSMLGDIFRPRAFARINLPAQQVHVPDDSDSTALFAPALNSRDFSTTSTHSSGCIFDNFEDSKRFSDDVYFGRHSNVSSKTALFMFSGSRQLQLTSAANKCLNST